jgi:undecaprenyl diphosphate synthase
MVLTASKPDTLSAAEIETIQRRLSGAALPRHIAIITDGNGRWARDRGMPRVEGHRRGYEVVRRIVRAADDIGIQTLTFYAFSAENWNRPKHEIDALMRIFEFGCRNELDELHSKNVRIRFIGRREGLADSLLKLMSHNEQVTANNTGLTLNLAINYGGRAEITDAVRQIAMDAKAGRLAPESITEQTISSALYYPDSPDPDLLIRTAGEMRISNFLLWQVAYSELWVTDDCWPDFTVEHLVNSIESFQQRVRKFGGLISDK